MTLVRDKLEFKAFLQPQKKVFTNKCELQKIRVPLQHFLKLFPNIYSNFRSYSSKFEFNDNSFLPKSYSCNVFISFLECVVRLMLSGCHGSGPGTTCE